jgi:hypothetical protein
MILNNSKKFIALKTKCAIFDDLFSPISSTHVIYKQWIIKIH